MQSELDAGLPGHGVPGSEPGVVDVGGGGHLQQSEAGKQDGPQGLRQATP